MGDLFDVRTPMENEGSGIKNMIIYEHERKRQGGGGKKKHRSLSKLSNGSMEPAMRLLTARQQPYKDHTTALVDGSPSSWMTGVPC